MRQKKIAINFILLISEENQITQKYPVKMEWSDFSFVGLFSHSLSCNGLDKESDKFISFIRNLVSKKSGYLQKSFSLGVFNWSNNSNLYFGD